MVVNSQIHVKSTYQASVQDTGPNAHTPVQDDIALLSQLDFRPPQKKIYIQS